MASVRSLGWNIGSVRELGGGAMDWGKTAYGAASGKGFRMTHRMAYTLALPVMTGLQGALLYYMYNGKSPDELKGKDRGRLISHLTGKAFRSGGFVLLL